jgi:RNA polymerase sigma-70 factor (ECF subfamily)
MAVDDESLIRRCLGGDSEAYGALVRKYQGAVYAAAFYYAGKYGSAEDIAQDAFLAAYRDLPKLNDHNKFGPWLRQITCRTAADWLRNHSDRRKKETPLPHRRRVSLDEWKASPDAVMERAERVERLQAAVDTLPERYRLPILLRYLQELTYDEISRFMGVPVDEVRGLLHRGTTQLRRILDSGDSAGEEKIPWRPVRK